MLSNELKAPLTGGKCTFCWEIINAVFSVIPGYSRKFDLKRYKEVITCTSIIVKSKFNKWYKLDSDNCALDVNDSQRSSMSEHYFTWVTECLKEIVRRRRVVRHEDGDRKEMEMISMKSPEMNKLLTMLLPKVEEQKLYFDKDKILKAISDFKDVVDSINNHLIRGVSSGEK